MKRSVLNKIGADLDNLKTVKLSKSSSQKERINANLEMQKVLFQLTNRMFPRPKEL